MTNHVAVSNSRWRYSARTPSRHTFLDLDWGLAAPLVGGGGSPGLVDEPYELGILVLQADTTKPEGRHSPCLGTTLGTLKIRG